MYSSIKKTFCYFFIKQKSTKHLNFQINGDKSEKHVFIMFKNKETLQ